ncbi:MAG: hypothetical protein ACOYMN_04635 [Roseimicrobium sp.]
MYRRVLYEDWHSIVPVVAFAVTFVIFTFAFIRALAMRQDKAGEMAAKPLDDGVAPASQDS